MDAAHGYFDGTLRRWPDVERLAAWDGLLLGNGMSINVWSRFDYSSLFEEAELDKKDAKSFEALDTTNFEVVLESLDRAIKLVGASGYKTGFLDSRRPAEASLGFFDFVRSACLLRSRI